MYTIRAMLIPGAVITLFGCAAAPFAEITPGSLPAEISAASGDEFLWRGRSFSPDRMSDAIRSAKYSEGITSIVLLYDSQTTVQDIIDVALMSKRAGLPAFYRQDGILKPIEVSQ